MEKRDKFELVDAECLYYEPRIGSGTCTLPPGHKCPYRVYASSMANMEEDEPIIDVVAPRMNNRPIHNLVRSPSR